MQPREVLYYSNHFGLMKDAVELPDTESEYWADIPDTPGSRAVVNAILERRRESEETGFLFTSRLIRFLTSLNFEAFGHACSNAIKPVHEVDLDSLAQSLYTVRDGSLESIRKVQQYQYGAILTTGIDLAGQIVDSIHQSGGGDLVSVLKTEILVNLPEI